MNIMRYIIICAILLAGRGFALTNTNARFALRSGGPVRIPGNTGAYFSDHDMISLGTVYAGTMPSLNFDGVARVGVDALLVYSNLIVFSSDVDFTVGTNRFEDGDLVVYDARNSTYSMYLDGSAWGFNPETDIDAATLSDDGTSLWFSIDVNTTVPFPFNNNDVITTAGGSLAVRYTAAVLGIPSRADIDALYYDGTNLYFSLDTTEKINGFVGRDEDVFVFSDTASAVVGVISQLDLREIDDLAALDEAKDSDGDGLTDYEELSGMDETSTYFSTSSLPLNPGYQITNPHVADTDGDGADDGEEAAAGTAPLDKDSFFHVDRFYSQGAGWVLRWCSAEGRYYDVQAGSAPDNFTTNLFNNVPGESANTTVTSAVPANLQFLRVVLDAYAN